LELAANAQPKNQVLADGMIIQHCEVAGFDALKNLIYALDAEG
jgi:hypothetical protein